MKTKNEFIQTLKVNSPYTNKKSFNNLIKLVADEADNLKMYATQEELSKLDFDNLIPNHEYYCIYGQMTGYCFSERATELLNLCTKPYKRKLTFIPNKTYKKKFSRTLRPYSPIECFIFENAISLTNCNEKNYLNKILIDYIKS